MAQVHAAALGFPQRGTKRAGWREREVDVGGGADYTDAPLDWVKIH
ncbi:MAG: hypothetical protein R2763_07320 [Mycobacterium sp.]